MSLLEREEQLRAAAEYLADAAAGHGRLVYVGGEAGVGKSTFVGHLVKEVGEGRASVAIGFCDGSATPAPLGPLVEMLAQLPAGLWPEGATRQQVFAGLLDTLHRAATPYLLVIEDVHWADEATLDLIRFLARRIHGCRALVLATFRPEDAAPGHGLRVVVGDTATAAGTRRMDLSPLTADAVATLVAEHRRGHPEQTLDPRHLHRVTGGNAFFVTEALSAEADRVPPTVRDAVLARVARLDEGSQRALELVALAGARAEVGLLGELYPDGFTALDEPLARGLLRSVGGDIVFRHELARLVVADEVPAGRSTHLHRRLLAALERRGADPARLAHHGEAAGDAAAVLRHAPEAAARAAALGAHQEAVRQYRRALRYADRLTDDERAELAWSLGYECYLTNRIEDAIEATRQALHIWEASGENVRVGDAWRCLSRLSWFAGRNDDAEAFGARAVEVLDGTETVEQAMAYSNRTQLRMLSSDLTATREWGKRTLELLDRLPDTTRRTEVRVHALNNLGTIEATGGNHDEGLALLRQSLQGARADDLHEHAARAYCNLVSLAVVQRRHDEAEHYLDEGLDYCLDRDLDSWTLYLLGFQARLRLDRGDATGARASAESVLRRAELASIDTFEPLLTVAQLALRAGNPEGQELLERAADLADLTGEVQRIAPATNARCEAAWISGDTDGAQSLAAAAWPGAASADCPWNRGAVATWLPPDTPISIEILAPPYAAECSGRWADAAVLWQETGSPFEEALALARSGERPHLEAAVGLFDRIDAPVAADRARALLRSRGWSAPPRRASSRRPDGLTPREAEVLDLLVSGLSDAQIAGRLVISRRTAEHHVASVLTKLGKTSRKELVDIAPSESG